jgi:DNA polymerase-3 subunit delta'
MAFDALIGNDVLRERLATDVREDKLSHAYIIEGATGSGKRTLARELCAALACTNRASGRIPCGGCLACRKVYEGKCPDITRIDRGSKAGIGVDDVRFLRADVLIEPNDLDSKIYIIEGADTMTVQAQNALLLTLEEPPPYVLFLLLCENATSLLETIRSRAPKLRLSPVPTDDIRAYLTEHKRAFTSLTQKEQEELLMIADGSIGRAEVLLDAKERKPLLTRRALAASFVEQQLGRTDSAAALSLMASLGNKREDIVALLSDVLCALRDLALLKRAETAALCFYADREEALTLCDCASLSWLLQLYDRVEDSRRRLLRNANVRLTLTSLLLTSR